MCRRLGRELDIVVFRRFADVCQGEVAFSLRHALNLIDRAIGVAYVPRIVRGSLRCFGKA